MVLHCNLYLYVRCSALASSTTGHFHVCFGRPLLRFQWGFQHSECFAISERRRRVSYWSIFIFTKARVISLYRYTLYFNNEVEISFSKKRNQTNCFRDGTFKWFCVVAMPIVEICGPHTSHTLQAILPSLTKSIWKLNFDDFKNYAS